MPASKNFTFGTDTRELPELPEGFGENTNVIWVGSNDEGVVRGYFRLYGAVGWTFMLCEASPHRNQRTVLISDPMNQSKWVSGPEHADILSFDWVGERPRYEDIDWSVAQAKFSIMMAHGHEQMREQAVSQIVQDTILEFCVEEGGLVPEERISEFSERLAYKFTHQVMRLPHEELLQNRKKAGENKN
ncbi:hypothetical protein [Nioella ostreopsis]|uniref:hypothetical protein n=1 Tax=Nioella ostreopsis TaxID=2448479 RepID=UPI000FDA63C1|nr:hypothetical protein [Nioella ostreopsis]